MNKFFRTFAIIIISSVIWFAAFESISAYWISRWGDPLDKAKKILISDSWLGWRQKANFNGKFLGISLKTNELGLRNKSFTEIKEPSKNILILGPSATFGWGVEGFQTYSFILEELLKNKYPGIKINVVNGGQIGFSSWQGLEFYKDEDLERLKAAILIIAYGVNDVDRFRFFYNSQLADKEEFAIPKNAWLISLQNILTRSNFINLLSRKVFNLWGKLKCNRVNLPKRRVEYVDFAANIEKLIQLGKANGSAVILLNTAYKLSSFNNVNPEIKDLSLHIAEDINKLNELMDKIVKKNGIILLDVKKCFALFKDTDMFIDPIHMSARGHKVIATNLSDMIYNHDLLKINK